MSRPYAKLPPLIDYGLIPLINLVVAFAVAGLVVLVVGESPVEAAALMIRGAFGYGEGIGFTLYYATSFIFTGLAVAVAFHGGLFNIGGEGQAYIGGLGIAAVALMLGGILPWWLNLPLAVALSCAFGAAWAFIPAILQAKRGSHIVITTIMFNFIAAALMTYLMVEIFIEPGQQAAESRKFEAGAILPYVHDILAGIGLDAGHSNLNLSFVLALICSVLFWFFVWRTRWGYEIRTVGQNEPAGIYGGILPSRAIIVAMCISGGLAGLVGVNEVLGVHHRLLLEFTAGYGFVGIAVALMGRNHPIGIFFAALLFGALYQGGNDLAFNMPSIKREMVVVIQGLVILFSGALENMLRPRIESLFMRRVRAVPAAE